MIGMVNKISEIFTESKSFKDCDQMTQFHFIISFLEIQLDSQEAFFLPSMFKTMNNLMGKNHILINPPIRNKSNLSRIHLPI